MSQIRDQTKICVDAITSHVRGDAVEVERGVKEVYATLRDGEEELHRKLSLAEGGTEGRSNILF